MDGKHPLEIAYWISQIFLAVIVLVGTLLARRQLRLLSSQARATFLMALDKQWEDGAMQDVRARVREAKKSVENRVLESHSEDSEDTKREKFKEYFHEHLNKMRLDSFADYEKFMKMWGFLETVGHLVKQGYVPLEEIESIFGYVVLQVDDTSRAHLAARNEEETKKVGHPTHLYENFRILADGLRNARSPSRSAGPISWLPPFLRCKKTT